MELVVKKKAKKILRSVWRHFRMLKFIYKRTVLEHLKLAPEKTIIAICLWLDRIQLETYAFYYILAKKIFPHLFNITARFLVSKYYS